MRTIWLIRHGESGSNAGAITDHPTTVRLTEAGVRQAEQIAASFNTAPDLIVVTPYQRTVETAAATRRRFPHAPVAEWPIHEFTFMPPARYRGTTIADRRPGVLAFWERCEAHHCEGEGAESFDSFMQRVRKFLARLRATRENFIAVFAHGYVIKAVLWENLYHGDRNSEGFMRGFRALHRNLPVSNGTILPLRADNAGNLFIGSPCNPCS
jgi:probable phosphoglycerate mutase